MRRFTTKTTYSIVFLSVLFLVSIAFYSNKDFYKQYIISAIYSAIDFKIEFSDSSLSVFPSPGIILNQVSIDSIEGENKIDAKIKSVEFLFSWKILFGQIELYSIHFGEGKVELTGVDRTKNKVAHSNAKALDEKNLRRIISFLKLDKVSFNSIQFIYKIDDFLTEEMYFNSLTIHSDHTSMLLVDLNLLYQRGNFISKTKITYAGNNFSYDSLEIESSLKIKSFPLKPLKGYYSFIYGANFDNTIINGDLTLYKEKFKQEYNLKVEADINYLHFKGVPIYPIILVASEFTYTHELKQINFINIRLNYENGAIASANGTLTFSKNIFLNLNIQSEFADIYKVIYLIVRFVDIRTNTDINFHSQINIICNRAIYDLYELRNVNLGISIVNSTISLIVHNANVLRGSIHGKGIVVASKNTTYNFEVFVKEINSEELISKYTKIPYLKGVLSSNLNFSSSGNDLDIFLENLQSKGKVEIRNGELLGYANILKPVFALGKIVNLLGPRGKNTEFLSLKLDYTIRQRNILIQKLKLIGVGIDAHGGGSVNFDRKIDFRIYAGLGGLAGKALYIPIVYKGIMPDNISYIDPVWIGSVYVGATLFGGPAGATVGGVAGSAVSEYINKAWEGIKGIFSKEEKSNNP